jgi:HAMP domain-containing protein
MKKETGDDYGLLLSKKFLNRRFWADTSAFLERRDNWNDNPAFVVADRTTANESIIQFHGDVATVAGRGKVLERFEDGTSVFVRGIFPIPDAAGNAVGAVFVVRDISGVYRSMRSTQNILVLLSIGGLLIGGVLLLALLNRMVFRRLEHIIRVATRVVGGDYQSIIQIRSDDEIGRFEQLFEQFRCVFVDLLANLSELEENT